MSTPSTPSTPSNHGTPTIDPRSEATTVERVSDAVPGSTTDRTVLRIVLAVLAGLTAVTIALVGFAVFLAGNEGSSTVTVDESAAVADAADVGPTLAEVVAAQRAYLESETAATPEQIDCVADALEAMGRERAIEVSLDGIGAAVYVPCGLPD